MSPGCKRYCLDLLLIAGGAVRSESNAEHVHCLPENVMLSYTPVCLQIAPTEEEVAAMRAYDGTLQGLAPPEKVMLNAALHPMSTQVTGMLTEREAFRSKAPYWQR